MDLLELIDMRFLESISKRVNLERAHRTLHEILSSIAVKELVSYSGDSRDSIDSIDRKASQQTSCCEGFREHGWWYKRQCSPGAVSHVQDVGGARLTIRERNSSQVLAP